jgi:hypothetical protein
MTSPKDYVRLAYGYVADVKTLPGNWSVKVTAFPQPAWFVDNATALRYGGWVDPDDQNLDGYGIWIPLGDAPEDIAQTYSIDLVGKFVEIRYTTDRVWEGRAYVIKDPGTEDMETLEGPERGLMRILSAVEGLL